MRGFARRYFFAQVQRGGVDLERPALAHARAIEQEVAAGYGFHVGNLDPRDIDHAGVRGGHAEGSAKAGEKDSAEQGIQGPPDKRRTRCRKNRTVDRLLCHWALVFQDVHGADGAFGPQGVRSSQKNQAKESLKRFTERFILLRICHLRTTNRILFQAAGSVARHFGTPAALHFTSPPLLLHLAPCSFTASLRRVYQAGEPGPGVPAISRTPEAFTSHRYAGAVLSSPQSPPT